ncbi:MAG: hypothetical protein ACREF1_11005, partial [Acetobacteraceae bacterium]
MAVQFPAAPLGQNAASSVVAAVQSASGGSAARFANLLAIAHLESGLRPDAQAAMSSAKGLFQFVNQSWLAVMRQH